MNIACPFRTNCPGTDEPLLNISSEVPDQIEYLGTGYFNKTPPLGTTWQATACKRWFNSTISQDDADQQASLAAQLCVGSDWVPPWTPPVTPGIPHPPQKPPIDGHPPDNIYWNRAITCDVTCPDGTKFHFTVPSGMFSGKTQAEADAAARQYCTLTAPKHTICLGTILGIICQNEDYNSTIQASGQDLAVLPDKNHWVFVGSKPSWVTGTVDPTDSSQFHITGTTPSSLGPQTFTVKITVPDGHSKQNTYTIVVWGISNSSPLPTQTLGVAYTGGPITAAYGSGYYSFAMANGTSLPPGLSLASDGTISGTPLVNGNYAFTIAVTDVGPYGSGTATCTKDFSMTITSVPVNVPWLYWKMEEGSGLDRVDCTVNAVHLVPSIIDAGSLTQTIGRINNGLHLHNPPSLESISAADVALSYPVGLPSLTMTCWFRVVSDSSGGTDTNILKLAQYQPAGGELSFIYVPKNLSPALDHHLFLDQGLVNGVPFNPTIGTWYFLAAFLDVPGSRIGISINNGAITWFAYGGLTAGGALLNIQQNGDIEYALDELGLWQELLPSDQLASLAAGSQPPCV